MQAEVCSRVGVILRQPALRTDGLEPFLCVNHSSVIDNHSSRIAGSSGRFGNSVEVEICLSRGVNDAADSSTEQESEVQSLITQFVTPSEIVFRENGPEENFASRIQNADLSGIIDVDESFFIMFQSRSGVEVAERTTFLEYVFRFSESFDFKSVEIERLSRNRVYGIVSKRGDFVLFQLNVKLLSQVKPCQL